MKILDTLKSANSNLARNKVRTTLTVIAIFVGAFTLALTTGIDTGVNRYIDAQLGNIGGENTLIITPKAPEINQDSNEVPEYNPGQQSTNSGLSMTSAKPISAEALKKIKNINGIQTASFYTMPEVDYITTQKTDKKFLISLSETVPGITVDMETGTSPNINSDTPELSIEPRFIEALGFKNAEEVINQEAAIGVTNTITGEQATIKAIITGVQSKSLINDGYSYINPALSNKISEVSRVGTDEIPVPHFAAIATLKEGLSETEVSDIKNKISDLGYQAQTIDDQIGTIRGVINAITGVLTMFAAIALLAASFGIINTLYMAVQERTREIGLMKAMGLSNGKVFTMFSLEAIMIGFWGSVVGIIAAMLAGIGINKLAKESFLGDLTGFTLIQFSIQNVLIIIGIICFIAFIAGTLPAVRASKLNPIEALRYE